jgi:3'-5' exoribonuclease
LPIDRTLLIAAGLLHDIGKIDTYTMTPLPDITDAHRFEGHLAISYAIVRELARPLRENPPYPGAVDEIDKLMNCILSHHGHLEFGSPVLPACIEAFLLSQADLTDARVASIVSGAAEALRRDPRRAGFASPTSPAASSSATGRGPEQT